ncbi:hypothetical protein B0A52_05664 [Exophiala mesophila]|uniref:glucose oxidase n=1 Tax=Exophiala mesophila TaxID=212818 RepID=A0A438N268_EXOME|nr:hypothetical protein B0A52_05664 [Exophiala mesophila]
MRSEIILLLGVAGKLASAAPLDSEASEAHILGARNIVQQISDSYDFVVVGGGLAGLVLGARLSEDSNHTVLVLESGGNGDEFRERIDTPSFAYFESLWPTELNWDFRTAPQTSANNNRLPWPRGKVLGGSSAINGLYMNRPGEIEVNAWQEMLGDMDGADNWSWESFYEAMKKSENFTPPLSEVAEEAGLTWNAGSFGNSGPIHLTYPGYTFPLIHEWLVAAQSGGVANSGDTYGGENWGSRSGYLDPLPPRSNYDVLANAHVTRILFNSSSPQNNITATGVEYTRDGGATKLTVQVNKEVILASGSVGSPTVLLYSGIGPKDVLDAAGVPVISELPGVGQHLQDHLSLGMQFTTDQETAGSLYASKGPESNDPKFLSFVNSGVAYVNASNLFGSGAADLVSEALSARDQYNPNPGAADVSAGYRAIFETTANKIVTSPLGVVEFLIGNTDDGIVNIGAALQHPFSHGSITIGSADPMDYPIIDPNYLANPTDVKILREGIKLIRRLSQTEPLSSSLTGESAPGSQVQSDEDWEDFMRKNVFTEYHPSSSCSMLPLDQGGVVDATLRVYGLSNVRVADASIPPISFSAHLMMSTYGIAEQASNIIRAFHNRPIIADTSLALNSTSTSSNVNNTSSDVPATSTTSAAASASSTADTNDANPRRAVQSWSPFVTMAVLVTSLLAL